MYRLDTVQNIWYNYLVEIYNHINDYMIVKGDENVIRFVKIRCQRCGSQECKKRPIGSWTSEDEGCIKEVSGLEGDKYFYYINEVRPLLRQLQGKASNEIWQEYIKFTDHIYNLPSGERFKY